MRAVYALVDKIPEESLRGWYRRLVRQASGIRSDWVRILMFPTPNREYGYLREWYENRTPIMFEGVVFPGMREADEYLSFKFGNWHEPETISKLATIIVADRDYEKSHSDRDVQEKFLRETFGTRVLFVRAAEVDISSNHIRRLLRNGRFRAAAKLLPAPVLDYIRVRRLYADTE